MPSHSAIVNYGIRLLNGVAHPKEGGEELTHPNSTTCIHPQDDSHRPCKREKGMTDNIPPRTGDRSIAGADCLHQEKRGLKPILKTNPTNTGKSTGEVEEHERGGERGLAGVLSPPVRDGVL